MTKGSRNLVILGSVACLIAAVTTSFELVIYRNSGDIYLDRSRPGFLPDEDEVEANHQDESTYSYSDTGELNANELDKYIDELKLIETHIQSISDPYGPAPLSDESLGISTAPQP